MLCQSEAARRWEGEHVKGFHSNEYELLWLRARRCCSLKAAPTMTLCVTWLVEIHSSSVVSHACFIYRLRTWSIRFSIEWNNSLHQRMSCVAVSTIQCKHSTAIRANIPCTRTHARSCIYTRARTHTRTHTRTYTHSHPEQFKMYCWDRTTAYSSFLKFRF